MKNIINEILLWMFLYVVAGAIHLFFKIIFTPFGFLIYMQKDNAMYNILYWPVILIKDIFL